MRVPPCAAVYVVKHGSTWLFSLAFLLHPRKALRSYPQGLPLQPAPPTLEDLCAVDRDTSRDSLAALLQTLLAFASPASLPPVDKGVIHIAHAVLDQELQVSAHTNGVSQHNGLASANHALSDNNHSNNRNSTTNNNHSLTLNTTATTSNNPTTLQLSSPHHSPAPHPTAAEDASAPASARPPRTVASLAEAGEGDLSDEDHEQEALLAEHEHYTRMLAHKNQREVWLQLQAHERLRFSIEGRVVYPAPAPLHPPSSPSHLQRASSSTVFRTMSAPDVSASTAAAAVSAAEAASYGAATAAHAASTTTASSAAGHRASSTHSLADDSLLDPRLPPSRISSPPHFTSPPSRRHPAAGTPASAAAAAARAQARARAKGRRRERRLGSADSASAPPLSPEMAVEDAGPGQLRRLSNAAAAAHHAAAHPQSPGADGVTASVQEAQDAVVPAKTYAWALGPIGLRRAAMEERRQQLLESPDFAAGAPIVMREWVALLEARDNLLRLELEPNISLRHPAAQGLGSVNATDSDHGSVPASSPHDSDHEAEDHLAPVMSPAITAALNARNCHECAKQDRMTLFSPFRGRHICGNCGEAVCSRCSVHRVLLPSPNNKAQRICDSCFARLTEKPAATCVRTVDVSAAEKVFWLVELPASLWTIPQLVELHLEATNIEELPAAVGDLRNLRILNLSNNRLTSLPESVGLLTSLIALLVGDNCLVSLPPSCARLRRLERLDLARNTLAAVPEWFEKLSALRHLDLGGNTTFDPDSLAYLGSLPALTHLYLRQVQMRVIPRNLWRLTTLKQLDLDDNQLEELHYSLGSLAELVELRLSNNCLRSLPESLAQLENLRTLVLSGNVGLELSPPVGRLRQLQHLSLANCGLRSLPRWLGGLVGLSTLELHDNLLESLPSTLMRLVHLRKFTIHNNPCHRQPAWGNPRAMLRRLSMGSQSRPSAALAGAAVGSVSSMPPEQLRFPPLAILIWQAGECDSRGLFEALADDPLQGGQAQQLMQAGEDRRNSGSATRASSHYYPQNEAVGELGMTGFGGGRRRGGIVEEKRRYYLPLKLFL